MNQRHIDLPKFEIGKGLKITTTKMKLCIFMCLIFSMTADYARGEEFDSVACSTSTAPRILDATNGVLTSPNYPLDYPTDSKCSWRIQTNPGDRILLIFESITLEGPSPGCPYDYVKVYDSATDDPNALIGTFCGTTLPANLNVQSMGNYLFIKFQSDRSNQYRGFKAIYSADGACDQSVLPRNIYDESGIVSSPFHPENYINNLRCGWLFHAHGGGFRMNISGRTEGCCTCDSLSLYRGTDNTYPLIFRLCGNVDYYFEEEQSNDFYLEFLTDGSVTYQGFNASYEMYTAATTYEPGSTQPHTLTTKWTTPPSTTPSSVTPPELDVYVTGTFETPSQTNISDDCVRAYSEELRKKLSSMGNLLNLELGQSLCGGNTQFAVYQTSLIYFHRDPDNAHKGSTRLAVLLGGNEDHSFGEFHTCSYQVSSYIADHGNWGRPLLSQLPGCPFLQFTPEMFTQSDTIWRCSS